MTWLKKEASLSCCRVSHLALPALLANQLFVLHGYMWMQFLSESKECTTDGPYSVVCRRIKGYIFLVVFFSTFHHYSCCIAHGVYLFTVGFYRGIAPGVTGSIATGATYFGFIESTKKWIEESNPDLGGHWSHFFAGAFGILCWTPITFLLNQAMCISHLISPLWM